MKKVNLFFANIYLVIMFNLFLGFFSVLLREKKLSGVKRTVQNKKHLF